MKRGSIPAAGMCIVSSFLIALLLILPAGASAENGTVGPINLTGESLDLNSTVNLSPAESPTPGEPGIPAPLPAPPRIVIIRTEVTGLNCTVSGAALPGSLNETISSLWWDWGDNSTPEEHGFPHSHPFAGAGTYLLTVTAFQSDGSEATEEETIVIPATVSPVLTIGIAGTLPPFRPEGPDGNPASGPVLTLLEPVVDRMNVTVNGNLNPGSPGATIASVSIDWGDGNASNVTDLPATHAFAAAGIFTINITGVQSDQQAITKGITVDIQGENPVPPGPAASVPPPVDLQEFAILLVIATAVIVVGLVAVGQRYFARRSAADVPEIPKAVSLEEARYAAAMGRGDRAAASVHAAGSARMFRALAERDPVMRTIYLELAEKWEEISRSAVPGGDPPLARRGGEPIRVPTREELERICEGTDVTPDVAESVIRVALEIGREGREGQAVGTSFVVGDTDAVLKNSRQFVLNPFHGHDERDRQITDGGIRGNIKEFAQLDGAFLVSGNGVVEAAGRYITVDMSRVKVPDGLGSRHSSIAGITQVTRSIGIVVSQSGGLITIFKDGTIVHTIGS